MLSGWLETRVAEWLLAYTSGHLDPVRALLVRVALGRSEPLRAHYEAIDRLERAVRAQPRRLPPAGAFAVIRMRVQAGRPMTQYPRLAPLLVSQAAFFAVALLVLVWAMPPGNVLQWTVAGQEPARFEIYRAETSDPGAGVESRYDLLRALPADEEQATYRILDPLLAIGQDYVYRVVALDRTGEPTASQTIVTSGIQALPGQLLAVLLIVAAILAASHSKRRWQSTRAAGGLRWA